MTKKGCQRHKPRLSCQGEGFSAIPIPMLQPTSRVRKNQFIYQKSFRALIKLASFLFRFAPRGLVSSLRLPAPLVFSSPPTGEIFSPYGGDYREAKQGAEGL